MTVDWDRFREVIEGHQRFLLTSHIRPDCDALGSELGMARILEALGKEVIIVNDAPVALDLPISVELEVTETDPSIKGGSATSRTKPAILSTGVTVQVPEHISTGDIIKVNVEETIVRVPSLQGSRLALAGVVLTMLSAGLHALRRRGASASG